MSSHFGLRAPQLTHLYHARRDYLHRRRPEAEPESPGAIPVAERRRERFAKWLEEARIGSGSTSRAGDEDVAMEIV